MLDLLVRGATIADGTGNPTYIADVAIEAGRIVAVGHLPAAQAAIILDAAGKVLAPGFIDVHLHSEIEMLNGRHVAGVQMGVTSELICPDGMSYAPLPVHLLSDYGRYIGGIYGDDATIWARERFADYVEQFGGRIRNNVASQVPHGVVRLAVKGWKPGPATDDELEQMRRLTRDCMEAGAVGINAGLTYAPACHSDLRELVELCRVVAEYGGVYAAHMRSYVDAHRDDSIAETVTIAQQAGVPVHISHFSGTPAIYASAEAARTQGIDITWDAYPYTAGCTLLAYPLPPDLWTSGIDACLAALGRPETRARLRDTVESWFPATASPHFAYVKLPKNKWMEGRRVHDVWQRSGKTFIDFYCDLLLEEDLAPLLIYPWPNDPLANEERVRNSMTHPLQMMSTDGVYVGSHPHPRGFGTYARMLGWCVREKKWLRLEDAVRRMTSFPAARFGLADRGLVRKGMAADLVIFDPATVADRATYEEPRLPPVGIDHVFVNGVAVVKDGVLTDAKPGRILRHA